ncbi:MAG: hypothetical protein ACE5DM_04295 [Candidatus Nanoarchaeia archaeon]
MMVKPAHVPVADRILSDLDFHAKRVYTGRVDEVPREVIDAHYACHK